MIALGESKDFRSKCENNRTCTKQVATPQYHFQQQGDCKQSLLNLYQRSHIAPVYSRLNQFFFSEIALRLQKAMIATWERCN